jgi:hypothetical protein
MHTQNVNTAAQESSERWEEKITMPQLTDLFLFVMVNGMEQNQPEIFVPPMDSNLLMAISEDSGETVIVWTVNGWPIAAAVPESNYLAVIPDNIK